MFNSRSAKVALVFIGLALISSAYANVVVAAKPALESQPTILQVTLSATQHTVSWDARDPGQQRFALPVLFLHHQREATAKPDRTLIVSITGLSRAMEIQLEAVSHHLDVTTGAPHTESKSYVNAERPCTAKDPCTIRWTLDATTPSDLYYVRVNSPAGETLWQDSNSTRPAFAALDSWDTQLGEHTVRIIYGTLFPYARGQNDLDSRLTPSAVTDFIEGQFVPIIRETWQTQFVEWGFGQPLHPEWDDDNVVEIIVTDPPFALFGGTGTYSQFTDDEGQPTAERRIWWHASNNSFQAYDSLESAYRIVFAHEFFHLMQWNTLLATGRPSNLYYNVIEAHGRSIPAAQYPELELNDEHLTLHDSAYTSAANRYIAQHLNSSLREIEGDRGNKYDLAAYWMFLYEQYGDLSIVRAALEEMAIHYGPDVVASMGRAMDAAFARVDGPFKSYEESVVAFASAIYALRLEDGRCTAMGTCDGRFFDPAGMYELPGLDAKLRFKGTSLTHRGAVPASYGMDFVEIALDRSVDGKRLMIHFQGEGSFARFNVQIWKLGPGYAKPHAVTSRPESAAQSGDGSATYVILQVDSMAYSRLALIITRVDRDEAADGVGSYTIEVNSAG